MISNCWTKSAKFWQKNLKEERVYSPNVIEVRGHHDKKEMPTDSQEDIEMVLVSFDQFDKT